MKHYRGNADIVSSEAALSAFFIASSTLSAVARITAILRCPFTYGLPKMRIWTPGSDRALSILSNTTLSVSPSTTMAFDADGP